MRKSGVVAVVLVVFAGLGFAANASDGTIDFSSETAQIVPVYVAGAYVEACLNEYCPGPADGGYIGAFYAEAADGDREFAWCIQAGALIGTSVFNTYSEVTIDGRVSYLTWRYDRDLFDAGGVANYELAAVQALAWAWVADARFDPDVFNGTDPLEWDGLTPGAWTSSSSNRVGFSTNKAAFSSDMGLATQATYDLAVEATAKAGPWGLIASTSGVTLSGSYGPIEGEEITFNSGGPVSTDSSGFAAWPTGATSASVEGPGTSFETRPSGSQDVLVSTVGIELSADRPADSPTPTTTTSTTTTTTVAPTTTTTTSTTTTSTTVAPTTTTTSTTVAPTTTTTSTTVAPTTTTTTSTTTTSTTTTTVPPTTTTVAPTTTTTTVPPTTTTVAPTTTTVAPTTTTTVAPTATTTTTTTTTVPPTTTTTVAPTATTTTVPPTTSTTTTTVQPTTSTSTTTVPPTTSTSTTTVPPTTSTTTTTVASTTTTTTTTVPPTTSTTSTTVASTTTTTTTTVPPTTTTTDPGPPILPATGMPAHRKHLPVAVLLVTCGALVALGTRRSHSA